MHKSSTIWIRALAVMLYLLTTLAGAQDVPPQESTPYTVTRTPRWIGEVGYLRYLFVERGKMAWGADYGPQVTIVLMKAQSGSLKEDLKALEPGYCAKQALPDQLPATPSSHGGKTVASTLIIASGDPRRDAALHLLSSTKLTYQFSNKSSSGGQREISGKDSSGDLKQVFRTTVSPLSYEKQYTAKLPRDFATKLFQTLLPPPWKLRQEITRLDADGAEARTYIDDNGVEAELAYRIVPQYDSSKRPVKAVLLTWDGDRQLPDRRLILIWQQDRIREEWTLGDDTAVIATYGDDGKVNTICDIVEAER